MNSGLCCKLLRPARDDAAVARRTGLSGFIGDLQGSGPTSTLANIRRIPMNLMRTVLFPSAGNLRKRMMCDTLPPIRLSMIVNVPLRRCVHRRRRVYRVSRRARGACAIAIGCARAIPLAVCRIFGVYSPGEAPHRLLPSLASGLRGTDRAPLSPGLQKHDDP
jgi:hypothetical protein